MLRRLLVPVTLVAASVSAWSQADAEYAIRWSPTEGGLSSIQQVSSILSIEGKKSSYDIRYYEVETPQANPEGFEAILRERVKSTGESDVTFKYRGVGGFPTESEDAWSCPLRNETKRKDEVDISVLADGSVRKSYSRSCVSQVGVGRAVPATITLTQKGCSSKMARHESRDKLLTVEEWHLSNGDIVLEVSMNGRDSDDELHVFRQNVVSKLLTAGIWPIDRSKTEIGTQCQ